MFLSPKRLSIKTAIKLRIYYIFRKLFKIGFKESYSQLGEDIAIKHIFNEFFHIKKGIYVDVGCNHPLKFSNSFKLYLEQWQGITVDLNKELISLHQVERKQDIQICTAVSDEVKEVPIYEFESDLVSSINEDFYSKNKEVYNAKPVIKKVYTKTLNQILTENHIQAIDLLLIDVEGHDLNVLKSINLEIYRPKLIVIEVHDFDLNNFNENPVVSYLKPMGYKMAGYLIANGYFIDENL